MNDYHNLYNLFDVILLADIFENFTNICMNIYGLDTARYFNAPGLARDAALKITKVQLELLSDPDMFCNDSKWHQRRNYNNISPPC